MIALAASVRPRAPLSKAGCDRRGRLLGLLTTALAAAAAMAVVSLAPAFAQDGPAEQRCGSVELPCQVAGGAPHAGSYLIALPQRPGATASTTGSVTGDAGATGGDTPATARLGALIYMHGWQGTARGVIRFAALRKVATRYGLAMIAPSGRGKTWSYSGSPSKRRDEFAFFDALLDDAVARFDLDPQRLIASGFSMGGSMAWYLACRRSARFAGFVPVAGAFWRPHPESCDGPPPLIVHTHGLSDGTVPMNGRPIGDGYHQGSVRESIELMRRESRCTGAAEPQTMFDGTRSQLVCTRYTGCASGLVTLCLHAGSHSIRAEWVEHGVGKVFAARGWARPGS